MATQENPDSISKEHHIDNTLIQIVDKDGEFIDMQRLTHAMQDWQLLDKGFDYYVVAILGCQSSGKSTLLNLVFGTEFQTMEAAQGRTQTTLGVWMGKGLARSDKEETVLVFDVEGTDSRERGEQAHSFERKSSLFSLALAEVLLINMWHTDVGRYNAGNIALLKTVFELNLQLFQRANGPKTLLLFVIRDHIPQDTPLEKLQAIIMKDMKGIWDGLIKPDVFANSKVEDFFDFEFTALPHKVLAASQFTESAAALRQRFVDGNSSNFILTKRYRKDIPMDGFPSYAQRIWAVVKDNKDLNIPSQKQMLAIYRCDEISAEAQKQFAANLQPLKKRIEAGEIVADFGAKTTEFFNQAVTAYNNHAFRYQKDVADQKREALQTTLTELLFTLFAKQLLKLNEKAFNQFEASINSALPKDNTAAVDFANIVEKATKETLDYYNKTAKALMLEGVSWTYDAELEELQNGINKHIAVIREAQLNKLSQEIKTLFGNLLFKPLDKIIESANPEMWSKIRQHYETNSAKVATQYRDRLQGFGVSSQETEDLVAGLDATLFKALKDRFVEKVKYLDFILSKKFEEHFNLDSDGLPRRWKPADDVPKIYKDAKQSALDLIELFCLVRLDSALDSVKYLDAETSDVDPKFVILTSDEANMVKDKFLKEADAAYLKALRDQETVSSVAHVPVYIIVLIIILGFNEFIWILTNPLLLLFFLLVGGGAAVLYMLNLGGPAAAVVQSVFATSVRQLQHYAQQQIHQSQFQARQKSEQEKKDD